MLLEVSVMYVQQFIIASYLKDNVDSSPSDAVTSLNQTCTAAK